MENVTYQYPSRKFIKTMKMNNGHRCPLGFAAQEFAEKYVHSVFQQRNLRTNMSIRSQRRESSGKSSLTLTLTANLTLSLTCLVLKP